MTLNIGRDFKLLFYSSPMMDRVSVMAKNENYLVLVIYACYYSRNQFLFRYRIYKFLLIQEIILKYINIILK